MIFKKRGQGKGLWNFPGGKVEKGETVLSAATRECQEETGLLPVNPRAVAELEFVFPQEQGDLYSNYGTVYTAESHGGILISENEECRSEWTHTTDIPYDKMWPNDRLWLPKVLAGHYVKKRYTFIDKDNFTEGEIE